MKSQIEVEIELRMADMAVRMLLGEGWVSVEIEDTAAGGSALISASPQQAAAILFLAVNGDAGEEAKLYELAEPAVEKLPLNLRPIP